MRAQLLSCAQLFATPWTIYSPPVSSVHVIFQAFFFLAISYTRGSSQPGIKPVSCRCIGRCVLYRCTTSEACMWAYVHVCKVTSVVSDCLWPVECCPLGFSVYGILQAGILDWVAMPFSRGSFWPRDWNCLLCLLHWVAGSLPVVPPGKAPYVSIYTWILFSKMQISYSNYLCKKFIGGNVFKGKRERIQKRQGE